MVTTCFYLSVSRTFSNRWKQSCVLPYDLLQYKLYPGALLLLVWEVCLFLRQNVIFHNIKLFWNINTIETKGIIYLRLASQIYNLVPRFSSVCRGRSGFEMNRWTDLLTYTGRTQYCSIYIVGRQFSLCIGQKWRKLIIS